MNCGDNTESIYDTGSGDGDDAPNESIVMYYNNIEGGPKIHVKCDIVNPAFFGIEVGDVLTFSSDIKINYGSSNTFYYMVYETQRSIGRLSVKCREVHNAAP